jgi:uncharacterized protein YndB with AHSA1/START domain
MGQQSVVHSTFVIERSFPVTPERVFAAFADPAKKRRWAADGEGREVLEFQSDFQAGGKEIARYRFTSESPVKGLDGENNTIYQDIQPNSRIVLAYTMTIAGRRISSSQATFEFLPTKKGTDLIFTEQGAYFEGSDGAQIRELGWSRLLEALAVVLEQVADHLDDVAEDLDELAQDLAGS